MYITNIKVHMRFHTKFLVDDKNKKLDLQINKSISIF